MAFKLFETPQPHLIPGYTGACPQFRYRFGDTYGHVTHKLLLDPSVKHSKRLILSDQRVNAYETDLPTLVAIHGYTGLIPGEKSKFGKRYAVQVHDATTEFQQRTRANKQARNQLMKIVALQSGKWEPASIEDRQLVKTTVKLPLREVRLEFAGIIREIPCKQSPIYTTSHRDSPLFMETDNPEKYIKKDYAGHIPYINSGVGDKTNLEWTRACLCEFLRNYRRRQSIEWAPVSLVREQSPVTMKSEREIYPKQSGLLPYYTGHIPGQRFRFGKTYGNDTIDSKRALSENFHF